MRVFGIGLTSLMAFCGILSGQGTPNNESQLLPGIWGLTHRFGTASSVKSRLLPG